MLLSEAKNGSCVKVVRLMGGRRQRSYLNSMGIFPGATIKVLDCFKNGPCKVISHGSTLSLCPRMIDNIEVEYIEKPCCKRKLDLKSLIKTF
jgi:Fe2+ transport system protein FeoA